IGKNAEQERENNRCEGPLNLCIGGTDLRAMERPNVAFYALSRQRRRQPNVRDWRVWKASGRSPTQCKFSSACVRHLSQGTCRLPRNTLVSSKACPVGSHPARGCLPRFASASQLS